MGELKDKLKDLRGIFGIRKLHKVGDSYMITVPKEWVMLYGLQDEHGDSWVIISFQAGKIVISPLDESLVDSIKNEQGD